MKKSISTTRKLLFLISLLALLFTMFSSTASAHSVSGVGPRPVIHNSSAAQSSSPCSQQYCYQQDPYTNPYTLCSRDYGSPVNIYLGKSSTILGTLWNVWSASCTANWVEGQLSSYALSQNFTLRTTISDQTAPKETQCYPDVVNCDSVGYGGAYITWSNMIDGKPKTLAVGEVFVGTASLGYSTILR